MTALVLADELAKDVAGAEAIIQRHKERKEEIDAQDDSFKASSQFGQTLISSGHYESEEVKEIVSVKLSTFHVSSVDIPLHKSRMGSVWMSSY